MRIVRVADSGGSVHIGQRSPGVEITPIDGHTGIAGLLASRAEELRALLEVTDAHGR